MIEKKKIAIMLFTQDRDGGIHHYAYAMATHLLQTEFPGIEIVLVLKKNDNRFDDFLCEKIIWKNLNPNRIKKMLYYISMFIGSKPSFLLSHHDKKTFSGIDALIVPNILYHPVYALGKPFVMTIHDLQEKVFPSFFSIKERLKRGIVNKALAKNAKKLLCESETIAEDIRKYTGVSNDKIEVIIGPIRRSIEIERSNEINEIQNFKLKQQAYIIFPSQFWPHKNHIRLIECFEKIEEPLKLVFVGHQKEGEQELVNICKQKQLSDRVIFLSYVPDISLMALYQNARLLVLPSLYESISLPVEEAKFLGLKISCSHFLGVLHHIPTQFCFDPLDVNDMREKINDCLNYSGEIKYNEIFDMKLYKEKFQKVFESLLAV